MTTPFKTHDGQTELGDMIEWQNGDFCKESYNFPVDSTLIGDLYITVFQFDFGCLDIGGCYPDSKLFDPKMKRITPCKYVEQGPYESVAKYCDVVKNSGEGLYTMQITAMGGGLEQCFLLRSAQISQFLPNRSQCSDNSRSRWRICDVSSR
ncbi:unnamed protein product, partial [Mesorhabditis belari]|uniref:Uncharacterized protein n=1 Tax=Mesorhabditis belari TaxID=2138241 RepID=A0AAF3EJF2_9BILA